MLDRRGSTHFGINSMTRILKTACSKKLIFATYTFIIQILNKIKDDDVLLLC